MLNQQNLIKIVKLGVFVAMLTPLIYIPQTIFSAVFGKMIFFQIIIELTLPFFLFLIIFYKDARTKIDFLTKLILLFFATIFISSIFGVDWDRSFWGNPSRMRGIFSLLHFLAFYFYIRTCFAEKADRKKLILFAILIGIAVSVWGIIERINPNFSIDKVSIKGESGHRIISTTGNPIFLAGYMLFIAFLSFYYFIKNKDYTRWLALVACVLGVVVIFFTETRGAFLGLIFGASAILFYFFLLSAKKQKIIISGIFLTFISCIVLLFILDIGALRENKYLDFSRITNISLKNADGSTTGRLLLWQTSFDAFLERPVFGWGLENFDYGFDRNYNPQFLRNGLNETFADRAHNWFLDFLVMGGIVGFLLYLSIFIYIALNLVKNKKPENSAFFGLFAGFAVFSFFAVDAPSMTLMLFFSLALVFNKEANYEYNTNIRITNNKKIWIFLLLCLCVLMAIWLYNIKPLQAGVDFIKFKHSNNTEEKVNFAEKFLDDKILYVDSLRLHFANEIFFKAKESNNYEYIKWGFERAIAEMEKASLNHPQDFSYLHTLGNLYLRKGSLFEEPENYNQAMEYFKGALELSPKRQAIMFQMATVYIFNGEAHKAVDLLRQAVDSEDRSGQAHWRFGAALLADNNKEEAYRAFKNAIKLFFVSSVDIEVKKAINLCIEYEDYKCAAILYKQLKLNPKTAEFCVLLAEAYLELGVYDNAYCSMWNASRIDSSLKEKTKIFGETTGYYECEISPDCR